MTVTTVRVIASTLFFVLIAGAAPAQTVSPSAPVPRPVLTTTSTPSTATSDTTTSGTTTVSGTTGGGTSTTLGAYDRLSIGNRKIARALFEAQKSEPATGTTGTATSGTGTTTTSKNLTLDQIAAMKQGGQGWGQVFKQMQAQGLVTEKNLGQVVSQYGKQQHASRSETTTASNRTADGDATSGSGHHGKADRDSSSGYGGGHGHGNAGSSHVNSGRGSQYRGGGNSGGTGTGGGHGKSK